MLFISFFIFFFKFAFPSTNVKENIIIESCFVVDFNIFNNWLNFTGNDSKLASRFIRKYFNQVAKGVDERFRGIQDSEYEFSMRLLKLFIVKKPSNAFSPLPFGNGTEIDLLKVLNNFTFFVKKKKNKLPNCDFYFGFTSYSGFKASGYAPVGHICLDQPYAVGWDAGLYGASHITTHELGHNLGSFHDGFNNSCSQSDDFIMAPSNSFSKENYENFSKCSIDAFKKHLNKLKSLEKNCLSDKNISEQFIEVRNKTTKYFGKNISIDHQCQFIYGPESYFCSEGISSDTEVCKNMFCYEKKSEKCISSVKIRAIGGTPCGKKKWCYDGTCVQDKRSPSEKEKCLFGDRRKPFSFDNQSKTCSDKGMKNYCDILKPYCCQLCKEI